eukprot:g2477.t1
MIVNFNHAMRILIVAELVFEGAAHASHSSEPVTAMPVWSSQAYDLPVSASASEDRRRYRDWHPASTIVPHSHLQSPNLSTVQVCATSPLSSLVNQAEVGTEQPRSQLTVESTIRGRPGSLSESDRVPTVYQSCNPSLRPQLEGEFELHLRK